MRPMNSHARTCLVLVAAIALPLFGCGEYDPPIILDPDEQQDNDPEGLNLGDQNRDDPDGDTPRADGSPCQTNADCLSGTCLDDDNWPDGHCSTVGCETDADCHGDDEDIFCLENNQGQNFCARSCDPEASTDVCRDGYACAPAPLSDHGWCAKGTPDENGNNEDDNDNDDNNDNNGSNGGTADVLDYQNIECQSVTGQNTSFDYYIEDDTTSYLVVPFAGGSGSISPTSIVTPSGDVIDFQGSNSFQAIPSQMFGGALNPTVIPAAPQFDYQLESGTHTYNLYTDDTDICYYLVQHFGTPTTIDLNIYLVGVPGLDADNADTHADMQAVINQADDVFAQAGIEIGEVRYFSVPSNVEQNHRIVRSEQDVASLLSHTSEPGDSAEELMSTNVVITEQFSMSGGGGALGVSLGIPGASGLHGTGLSGVAMTGEYIGQFGGGNQMTAQVLAHEVGHYLGLFHTTEQTGSTLSPLQDVPQCSNINNPTSCPDWGNLMFPMADMGNNELTSDQSYVIQVNPVTQ